MKVRRIEMMMVVLRVFWKVMRKMGIEKREIIFVIFCFEVEVFEVY